MVRTKVFVGNLSFQTQEAELAAEFGKAGKVISANIITRGPRSLGYGFVEMDSEEDAHNAVKTMSKKEINGREINVEIAKPQDESKVRQPRPKVEGQASPRRRPRRRTAKKENPEGTQAPPKKESKQEEGENKGSERPRRRNRRARGTPGQKRVVSEENREESKTTLFVANLPFSLDDEGFAKVVTDLSLKLKTAHVVKKRNGRSKGYGFVEFDSQEDQQKALAALNKKVVDNRELSVKIALTELKREEQQEEKKEGGAAPKPAEKKAAPAEKKAAPAEKKAAPAEKKAAPAEKKAAPAEKKAASPATAPAEKKAAPAEKKAAPAAAAPAEKKASPAPEKKAAAPAEKKAAPAEKKASPVPAEKKSATPEKKDEKK